MEHVFNSSYYKMKGLLISIPIFLLSQSLYVLKEYLYNSKLVDVNPPVSNLALSNFISLMALWYTATTICAHVKFGAVFSYIISAAAKATFGAYLIHTIVISKLPNVYPFIYSRFPHPMVAVITTEIVFALVALLISIILGFIPGIRKLTASELPKMMRV